MKRICFLILGVLFVFSQRALAYREDYPPYKFKDGPPKSLVAEPISEEGDADFQSKDGKIRVLLKENHFMDSKLLIKDGNQTLMKLHVSKAGDPPFPNIVYWVDIDGNGLKDFMVLSSYRGSGLAAHFDHVDIFLKKPDLSYQKISYDTLDADIHDFVDLKKNGKCQVIITSFFAGKMHNHFSYDIYEIKNYKLVNADQKFQGFPKFIHYTNKKNDKSATDLTDKEMTQHIKEVESKIKYEPGV